MPLYCILSIPYENTSHPCFSCYDIKSLWNFCKQVVCVHVTTMLMLFHHRTGVLLYLPWFSPDSPSPARTSTATWTAIWVQWLTAGLLWTCWAPVCTCGPTSTGTGRPWLTPPWRAWWGNTSQGSTWLRTSYNGHYNFFMYFILYVLCVCSFPTFPPYNLLKLHIIWL